MIAIFSIALLRIERGIWGRMFSALAAKSRDSLVQPRRYQSCSSPATTRSSTAWSPASVDRAATRLA
jgi:hypothetical protein